MVAVAEGGVEGRARAVAASAAAVAKGAAATARGGAAVARGVVPAEAVAGHRRRYHTPEGKSG